uniref:Cystatin n=1 Tax=Glyptapanteles flavicoxis TaxID=463051 RepID=B7S843_9HYME|nr:cystatin [Glyptapanteles flavicoxis]ACE75077.1 cystatin [Glyptapanteles flavicoxis]
MFKEYRVLLVLLLCLVLKISVASARRIGGVEPISIENSRVKSAAEHAMKKINKNTHGERTFILVEIEEAKYQVVAGFKYILRLKVGETNCLREQSTKKCKLDESRPYQACQAEIWDQPWLEIREIHYNCNKY